MKYLKIVNNLMHKYFWISIILTAILSIICTLSFLSKFNQDTIYFLLFPFSAGTFAAIFTAIITSYKEHANIKITPVESSSLFFHWDKSDHFTAPCRLIIYTTIENLTSVPFSIIKWTLTLPNNQILLANRANARPLEKYEMSHMAHTNCGILPIQENDNLLKPILTFSKYEAKEGFIFFPGCPEIKEKSFKAILCTETTRGSIYTSVIINKYNDTPPKKQFHNIN